MFLMIFKSYVKIRKVPILGTFKLVGLSGLEPPTPTLSGWCSNRLSYKPSCFLMLDWTESNRCLHALSGKVFLKCGWNTYCLLTFIYENFSTTKFLLQQNKSNLLLQFVANVLIFHSFFALELSCLFMNLLNLLYLINTNVKWLVKKLDIWYHYFN